MANKKGISQEASKRAFIEAMYKTFGNVSASCRVIGVARKTVYDWAKKDPEFKAQMESKDYEEAYMDAIEGKLAKLGLQDENPTVLIFLAKTKAKKRGYVETQESKHTGIPAPVNINVTTPENAEKLKKFIENASRLN